MSVVSCCVTNYLVLRAEDNSSLIKSHDLWVRAQLGDFVPRSLDSGHSVVSGDEAGLEGPRERPSPWLGCLQALSDVLWGQNQPDREPEAWDQLIWTPSPHPAQS